MISEKKKIKVGLITDDIDRKAMGTAFYMQKLIEVFTSDLKNEIELVLIHRDGKCKVSVCSLARNISIKTFKFPKYTGITSFLRFFFTCQEDFDIIHFPRPKLFPFFWKLKAKKFVVTFHDAPVKGSPVFRTPANYIFQWLAKFWGRHHIDAAIGDAQYSKKLIENYYKTKSEKTFGIKLAGTIEKRPDFSESEDYYRRFLNEKYGIQSPYVLQVGRLVPHKNVHRVIRAFDIVKQKTDLPHQLVILGGRGHAPPYEKIVDEEIGRAQFKHSIYIAPYIETEDLPIVYAFCELFIQAGILEGFSIPIVDALKMGVPIVTSNTSVFPELVGNAAELVNPLDPVNIADGLQRVLQNKDLRNKLSAASLAKANEYSWRKAGRDTLEVYRTILKTL